MMTAKASGIERTVKEHVQTAEHRADGHDRPDREIAPLGFAQ